MSEKKSLWRWSKLKNEWQLDRVLNQFTPNDNPADWFAGYLNRFLNDAFHVSESKPTHVPSTKKRKPLKFWKRGG